MGTGPACRPEREELPETALLFVPTRPASRIVGRMNCEDSVPALGGPQETERTARTSTVLSSRLSALTPESTLDLATWVSVLGGKGATVWPRTSRVSFGDRSFPMTK